MKICQKMKSSLPLPYQKSHSLIWISNPSLVHLAIWLCWNKWLSVPWKWSFVDYWLIQMAEHTRSVPRLGSNWWVYQWWRMSHIAQCFSFHDRLWIHRKSRPRLLRKSGCNASCSLLWVDFLSKSLTLQIYPRQTPQACSILIALFRSIGKHARQRSPTRPPVLFGTRCLHSMHFIEPSHCHASSYSI